MIEKQKRQQIYNTSSQLLINQKNNQFYISISISTYPNCVFIVINQSEGIGSILRATVDSQTQPSNQYQNQQYDPQDYQPKNKQQANKLKQSPYIYECRTLFGSTQIQFYDLLMRRIAELIFEQNKMNIEYKGQKVKVFLNISLTKVHTPEFQTYQNKYYEEIIQKIKVMLPQVI